MRALRVFWLCIVIGCGSSGATPDAAGIDSVSDTASIDAAADAPTVFGELYLKASDTTSLDRFGSALAFSSDGSTLAVGAFRRTHVNSSSGAGAVYVFTHAGTTWQQQALVVPSNPQEGDEFGHAVALSADGNTLAVGAMWEDSSAVGIDGDQTNNGTTDAGAVYVFTRSGGTWTQQAYIKASNTGLTNHFGSAVALSGDGNMLAVGATGERSAAPGIDGNQSDTSKDGAGAVYLFGRSGNTWAQAHYIKASNPDAGDQFGSSVALTPDASTLVVGARFEASSANTINGDQTSNNYGGSGAVYVFTSAGTSWSQQAYIKASNRHSDDQFGMSLALAANGDTLAVGAPYDPSGETGVGTVGNPSNVSADNSGAVYVFTRSGGTWSQQAYIKATNTDALDWFGQSVAISAAGDKLVIGAYFESSNASGLDGDQTNDSLPQSGAAYELARAGTTWTYSHYVKASNPGMYDTFGNASAISGDGSLVAIAAELEDGGSTGIGGDQTDNSKAAAGAVYILQ